MQLMGVGNFSLGENVRDQARRLYEFVPEKPYDLSSDPQGVLRRKLEYDRLSVKDPDNPQVFDLLTGMLIRLDQAKNYEDITAAIATLGTRATPELEAIIGSFNPSDPAKSRIIAATRDILTAVTLSTPEP